MVGSPIQTVRLPVRDYDLAATLSSGQAFRWRLAAEGWEGVVAGRWIRLVAADDGIIAACIDPAADACSEPSICHPIAPADGQDSPGSRPALAAPSVISSGHPPGYGDWIWLTRYLQTDADLEAVLRTFPADAPMQRSVAACRGLRLLRQDPWECLVSFICSSTKQIVQIQQIIDLLCERFGERIPCLVAGPEQAAVARQGWTRAFPSPQQLAAVSESELRGCKMGFRAPYVLAAARAVAGGALDLDRVRGLSCDEAREVLTGLPGVGPKIANCVLLFAYGFQAAFPVDVWVRKALRELYFPGRRPNPARLERFARTHFGPHAGYAQQYLFHYMRTRPKKIH